MMLRKLTNLSRIDFGLYKGKIVDQIMSTDYGNQYMKWLYFNSSHIDLSDELFTKLNIEHKLIKPGKDPILFEEYYKPNITFKSKAIISRNTTPKGSGAILSHFSRKNSRANLTYQNRTNI